MSHYNMTGAVSSFSNLMCRLQQKQGISVVSQKKWGLHTTNVIVSFISLIYSKVRITNSVSEMASEEVATEYTCTVCLTGEEESSNFFSCNSIKWRKNKITSRFKYKLFMCTKYSIRFWFIISWLCTMLSILLLLYSWGLEWWN